jgi:hypothetical protein
LPAVLCVLLLSVITLAGCSSPEAPAKPDDGTRTTPIGRFAIPLPPGDWRLVISKQQDFAGGRGIETRNVLVSVDRGVIDRVVLLYLVEADKRFFFQSQENCREEYYYYQTPEVSGHGQGECWHVRNVSFGVAGKPHWISQVLDLYAKSENLYFPVAMVGVRYIRYNGPELLRVDYLWNPDVILRSTEKTVWLPDDWTNAAVAADPRRKAVMETIRQWGADWQARIASAFP